MTLTSLPDPPASGVPMPAVIATARVAVEIKPGAEAAELRQMAGALIERAERMEGGR